MNYPILFASDKTVFTNFGLGVLKEASSCNVVEERNGEFELEMRYPVTGKHFGQIRNRCIILAKPSPGRDPQPFRIYRITKPFQGEITIYARHISYDLSGIPIAAFSATTAKKTINKLNSEALTTHPFTFATDISKTADFASYTPASIRSLLGGKEGSILDVYGGEWLYDGFTVSLLSARGQNRGVSIRYGKNLTTLEQEENISDVYTGVLPFWYSENDGLVTGDVQAVPGTFDYVRILTMDFSSEHNEKPTKAELNIDAHDYILNYNIGQPVVSIKTSFADLSQASGNIPSQAVELCDTVTVIFEKLDISKTAKVVKTDYDVLRDRYIDIEIGDVSETIVDTIADQNAKLQEAPTKSFMQKAITYATDLITGNHGGYVVFHDSDGDGFPDEILIMDTANINTAVHVWRWNSSGLGYSSNGYAGPYGTAITIDGMILGDYLKVNTVEADRIVNHSIDDTQVRSGGISVHGSNGGSGGGVLAGYTIGNYNIGGGAVAYGNTSFTSTLDQVGTNAADITALKAYFNGVQCNTLSTAAFYLGGYDVRWKTISEGGLCLGR